MIWLFGWWVRKIWFCRIRRRHRVTVSAGGSYCFRCGLLKTVN